MFKTRFISMLVLLMTAVTGAWADEPKVYASGEVELFSLQLDDIILPGVTLTNKGDKDVDANSNGNRYSIEGVIQTMGNRISSIPFSIGVNGLITAQLAGDETYDCMPITEDGKAGNAWVVTYIDAPSYRPSYKEINIGGTTYAAPAASTYTVTLKEDTEDTDNWTITPAEATTTGVAAGTEVKATYGGTKKVKSVKAVKKAAWDGNLSTLAENVTVTDGMTLTGTLNGLTQKYKITIADGATVTLDNATINGVHDGRDKYMWAGINCEGDATIILKDGTTNSVKGFNENYPGIFIAENKTLTIKGTTGSLTASSNGYGTGIGGGRRVNCGSIDIQGGVITANGSGEPGIGGGSGATCGSITISGGTVTATCDGSFAAGIGSGYNGSICGNITISGGTVMATGGMDAAGIGSGFYEASCGDITITSGVTKVTATKGMDAPNSIGAGTMSSCGTVTIEDGANVTMN